MASSSAAVPIMVAFIGIVGTILPIYINNVVTQDHNNPDIDIRTGPDLRVGEQPPVPSNVTHSTIVIKNKGDTPATNLSVILDIFPLDIINITNKFSTTEIILPKFNDTFEAGITRLINSSQLEIRVPKLVHGNGSIIELDLFINSSKGKAVGKVYGVFDQGSVQGESLYPGPRPPLSFPDHLQRFNDAWIDYIGYFYIIFYSILILLIYLYVRRRRSLKWLRVRIAKSIMEIRGLLRNNLNNKDTFTEVWFEISDKKRQKISDLSDYLLIDDFYSELRKRNSYLSSDRDKGESDLPRVNTLSKLNETLLAAAENVLNKVDWNKYR